MGIAPPSRERSGSMLDDSEQPPKKRGRNGRSATIIVGQKKDEKKMSFVRLTRKGGETVGDKVGSSAGYTTCTRACEATYQVVQLFYQQHDERYRQSESIRSFGRREFGSVWNSKSVEVGTPSIRGVVQYE